MNPRIYFFLFFMFNLFFVSAQQFGGNPPSLKWKQINTDTLRVIFPAGLDSQARRIAALSELIERTTANSIGSKIRKVNIVLQPATTISNAYVALGPFRSEFQLTPLQNSFELGSLPWTENLTIHEWRHVQQYSNFNRGLSKAFSILFGEEGQALANALSVPDWFFEGDATYHETQVSRQGRGRLPFFFNGYRSLWEEGKEYSWMKLRNGSLRDYVPSHYHLGYLMVVYGYAEYGVEFWKKVTQDAASFKGLFYPLQKAIRRQTGISYVEFRKAALAYGEKKLNADLRIDSNNKSHFIADEEYPYWIDSTSIVYLRSSYDRIPAFTIRENGKDRKIRARDIAIDNYFSYRNGKIVYAAYRPHLRWGWTDFSDLRLLDIRTGKQTNLTTATKYFSPDISEDGKMIVAVHMNDNGSNELHLLDEKGVLIRKFKNEERFFHTYPKFNGSKSIVTAARNDKGEMTIAETDLNSGNTTLLLPFSMEVVGFPWIEKEVIYYSASGFGHDRIYRIINGLAELVPEQFKYSSNTGNYQLNTLGNKLVWTKFTASGFRLVVDNLEPPSNTDASNDMGLKTGIVPPSTFTTDLLPVKTAEDFPVKPFGKSFKLLNFHSRRPYISDPDYTFSFVSSNVLNTLQAEAYIGYNRNEGYTQVGLLGAYAGWFPVITLGSSYTFDRNTILLENQPNLFWDEWENRIGISIPLDLTSKLRLPGIDGRSSTNLTFGTEFVHNRSYIKGYYKDSLQDRSFGYLDNEISFRNSIQQARKQIYPRFAQTILFNYKTAVTDLEARQFLTSGSFYLPGAFINHSLVLQGAFHIRDSARNYFFANSFPFSRGYTTANFRVMWKVGGNYHLPLVYPDWGFGDILYFLRIRANLFYDFTRVSTRQLNDLDFRSVGTEIYFDTRWWNQLPISMGIRYSRLLDSDIGGRAPNQWEFVLPVNLLSR